MFYEIAEITIKPGSQAEFEAAVAGTVELFRRAKGCLSMRLEHGVESSEDYRLVVGWETVADHMVGFRESADFQQWRAAAGPFFAVPPKVEHFATVVAGF